MKTTLLRVIAVLKPASVRGVVIGLLLSSLAGMGVCATIDPEAASVALGFALEIASAVLGS